MFSVPFYTLGPPRSPPSHQFNKAHWARAIAGAGNWQAAAVEHSNVSAYDIVNSTFESRQISMDAREPFGRRIAFIEMEQVAEKSPIAVVVDDEPLIRMDTADIISDAGFRVLEASGAEEAFAFFDKYPTIRLLITDIQMPDIDGLTLARHVAVHWPNVSIVITSGAVSPRADEMPHNA
ncbi:response regulator [Rhizobium sp. PL01]|uniref:response regulator n=1 Tax=Rhizobium sp. PL01 TaxID=3085631 RepID=UPI00298295A6|nr:response regulator [Rhizobium sp. PL01]MDW5318555.1 response regulator [Rhizobium sp. PL01]